ncbi:MAG: hypothetical protein F6K35_30005 [Okeania sp. SIO2H7]|nr:hypothetical protein [Okeania sp. SIO2H7]
MEAKRQVKLMEEDYSEKLKAFTKIMLVSMLWRGAGLLESDKESNQENANREKEQNSEDENPSES